MKKVFTLTLIIILMSGSFSGCKKDKGDPPGLPPAESMLIDFSNFISNSKSADLGFENKGTENLNWETAALIVGTWRTIIAVTLAIPVASFKVAVDQDPVYLSDKKWQWSYNVSAAGVIYKARLTGAIVASDVQWEMYIAREGADAFPEFKWFEGTSKLDGTGGQWTIAESNTVQTPILQIDWTKSGTEIGTIKYTYLKSGNSNGAYIEYGITNNAYNAYFTVHYYSTTLVKFSDVNIEWNTSTKEGRIKSSDYLLGTWYCWNAQKVNVDCQ
ncbi:MAG TPA: hypothetical protein VMV47_09975 [Bacteroidales bacterium]|nr:hypothetical protein [Bacteroidales bacterium]